MTTSTFEPGRTPRGVFARHVPPARIEIEIEDIVEEPTLARAIVDELPCLGGTRVDVMDLALMILLEEKDEMTVGGVARALGLARASASEAIHAAIARGFLERLKGRPLPASGSHAFQDGLLKQDDRVATIRLTAKGMRFRSLRRGGR